ncbi:unnamed protein product [Diatraea saccharalis]|uniref:Uncharacterized protein n=1 Tax=Diatraea saccharalis TaxID=40085 RepID=A0A9N9QUZ2_9NEOP|nr:unnamed protein product [Diatraea saccharalis]
MKTLVVIFSLASLALAAPATQHEGTKMMASKKPEFIKREKKSPQDDESLFSQTSALESLPDVFDSENEAPVPSARSHFGFKVPILVKKKTGYHYYRDSDEERAAADPQENCGSHMRFKLCNSHNIDKSSNMRAALNEQFVGNPNNDVESSLQVAKEAIQTLEQNMQKLEQNGNWKHGQSDLDTSMHQNIEAVRQALQNVQGRVGKLESMSLRATTIKDKNAFNDMNKGNTEEERLAQWKEAMENIQKNVELASNIEDSFKSANNWRMSEVVDTTKLMRSHDAGQKNHDKIARGGATINKRADDDKNFKFDHHKTLEKRTSEKHNLEMTAAASEQIKNPVEHISTAKIGKSADMSLNVQSHGLHVNHNSNPELKNDKNTEKHSLSAPIDKHHNHDHVEHMKDPSLRSLENKLLNLHAQNMQNRNTDEHEAAKKVWEGTSGHHMQGKNNLEETKHGDTVLKIGEHKNIAMEIKNTPDHHTLDKQTEIVPVKTDKKHIETKEALLKGTKKEAIDMHNEATQNEKHEIQMKHSEFDLSMHKKSPHMSGHYMHMPGHEFEMHGGKHFEGHDLKNMHGSGMYKPGYGMHMKEHGMHMPGHQMHIGFDIQHSKGMKHGMHGKSSDLDSPMQEGNQQSMSDVAEKSAMDSMSQWKHHDLARSSYGPPAYSAGGLNLAGASGLDLVGAGGSGALGIFPNAKVGGCAIPLLLGCSPTVVPGSLAKSHSGYAAPAYRDSDDLKFKKKRDVIKTSKNTTKSKMNHVMVKKNTKILETLA